MSDAGIGKSPSISFLDDTDFLEHDVKNGRLDKVLNAEVTLSATPDGSGGTAWEAKGADGRNLRLFRLTIEPVLAAGPVVVDALEGVYVCYEDAAAMQTWCVQVKRH